MGEKLLAAFHPIMQPAAVQKTVNYDVKTFAPLGPFATGAVAAAPEVPTLVSTLATALNLPAAQVSALLAHQTPVLSGILTHFPQLVPIFKNVPPGLAWYKPIVNTMNAQQKNFAASTPCRTSTCSAGSSSFPASCSCCARALVSSSVGGTLSRVAESTR